MNVQFLSLNKIAKVLQETVWHSSH